MTVRYRIVLSALLATALAIAACANGYDADDEESHRVSRGIGTSPSANGIGTSPSAQDAGLPDAAAK